MLFLILFLLPYLTQTANIQCHQCGGAESFPKFAKDVFTKLNISSATGFYGDCKAKSGNDMCQNGTFCLKRANIYQIKYTGISLKWTTYTKTCASLRVGTDQVPTEQCYNVGTSTNKTGYTMTSMDCYCQKAFCNSSPYLMKSIFASAIASFIYLCWAGF